MRKMRTMDRYEACTCKLVFAAVLLVLWIFLTADQKISAEEFISGDIRVTELNMERVVGENPDTQINCDNSHVDVEVHWIDRNNGRDIDTFTPGQIVELQVYFFPQSGYKFGDSPSPEFYINGSNVTIEPRYVNNTSITSFK